MFPRALRQGLTPAGERTNVIDNVNFNIYINVN